ATSLALSYRFAVPCPTGRLALASEAERAHGSIRSIAAAVGVATAAVASERGIAVAAIVARTRTAWDWLGRRARGVPIRPLWRLRRRSRVGVRSRGPVRALLGDEIAPR